MVNTERIKQLRASLSRNQNDVANALNLSREAYCMYENGQRHPSYETLILLAKYYHVSLDYLLSLTDIPESFNDFSSKEKYIIRNLKGMSDDVLSILALVIKHELAFNKSKDLIDP